MITLLLIAVALAADAFAAAVTQGAAARPGPGAREALRIGAAFGAAQALMPLFGWALSLALAATIQAVDHWIAFVLLALIGGHMVHAGWKSDGNLSAKNVPLANGWVLFTLAIATSIDAAAVGVTLSLFGQPVLFACAVIGAVTFVLSTVGVLIGAATGAVIGQRAEAIGGLVLIAIGTKILIEHLYFGGRYQTTSPGLRPI